MMISRVEGEEAERTDPAEPGVTAVLLTIAKTVYSMMMCMDRSGEEVLEKILGKKLGRHVYLCCR